METAINDELSQARARLEASREAIRAIPELSELAARLERAAAEVKRIEKVAEDAKSGSSRTVLR